MTYGFDERRLHKVFARVLEPNSASQRLLDRLGFEREGRLRDQAFVRGEPVDVLRYGLLESAWDAGE